MKKNISPDVRKYNELLCMFAMGSVCVLLAGGMLGEDTWSGAAGVISVLCWLLLLNWSKETSVSFWIWGSVAVLTAGTAYYLYHSEKDMTFFLLFLELEAACLCGAFIAFFCEPKFWRKVSLLSAETAGLIYCGIADIALPKWGVCMGLFGILMLITELTEFATHRKNRLEPRLLAPVFVCLMLGLFFLPVQNRPAEWKLIKKAANAIEDTAAKVVTKISILFGGAEDYALPFAGYDEEGSLGASLDENADPQLSVRTVKMNTPLYLTGSIYDIYNGSGWEKGEASGTGYLQQYVLLRQALENSIYTGDDIWGLTRYRTVYITYEGIQTESLFLPPQTAEIQLPGGKGIVDAGGGNTRLKKAEGTGFSYEVSFLEIDYGNEMVENLLRQQVWEEAPASGEEAARQFAYDNFTALPDTLPKRVYTLADEITGKADNDYDRLCAIQSYLKQMTYNTVVSSCPKGFDPMDYFLFETQSGYCTYFASAMAVLGRCEGIPMRYVEGFVTSEVMTADQKELVLTGMDAHAWAEAYIENVGWIPFEATPGYAGTGENSWKASGTAVVPHVGAYNQHTGGDIVQDTEEETETKGSLSDILPQLKKGALLLVRVLLFLLLFLGGFVSLLRLKRFIGRRNYLAKPEKEKLKALMEAVFMIGKKYGIVLEPGETLLSYAARGSAFLDTKAETAEAFCSRYEAVRFGNHPVSSEDLKQAEQFVLSLEKQYLESCGRARRLVYYMR